jgi:uncharacterized membrane protein YphA (DoxX/SURF4 family)
VTLLHTNDEPEAAFDVGGLVLRVTAGLGFLALGYLKLVPSDNSTWVATFERIGLGMWFMTLAGALQAIAGALLLVPRTALAGAALAAATMVGAMAAQVLWLDGIAGAVIPGAVLA